MSDSVINIVNVVGARPNFIKIAPLMRQMVRSKRINPILLHTGQHYDYEMSQSFFNELEIREPDVHLEVGSGSQAEQVAKIMTRFDTYCEHANPDAILVVGDVNSTMATSIVASKRGIKIFHVEAGIRSGDRTMPEEINRLLTDSITDVFFPPSVDAVENLLHEGHKNDTIHRVGNIMIDTLMENQTKIDSSSILNELEVGAKEYVLLTLHRPSNVDDIESFTAILKAINTIQKEYQIVFPMHPRTLGRLKAFSLEKYVKEMGNVIITQPLGYFDFGKLTKNSKFVLTDSGGIQEETTVYGIPCITLRYNTERPITVEQGTNELAGSNTEKILSLYQKIKNGEWKAGKIPDLWDGRTAERIVEFIEKSLPWE